MITAKLIKNGRKFSGRAFVIHDGNNIYLQSYDTIVLTMKNGELTRNWKGYSQTTARHIGMFLDMYKPEWRREKGSKTTREWYENLPYAKA